MNTLRNSVLLLGVVGIAAAAAPFLTVSPHVCFTAGSVTYQLSASAPFPDYRVAIDNQALHPDLRVRLVDRVEDADFALTDDAGAMVGSGCRAAGPIKTIGIVPAGQPSDLTIAVSSQPAQAEFAARRFHALRPFRPRQPFRCRRPDSRWSGRPPDGDRRPRRRRPRGFDPLKFERSLRAPSTVSGRLLPRRRRALNAIATLPAQTPPHNQRERGRRAPDGACGKPAAGCVMRDRSLATVRHCLGPADSNVHLRGTVVALTIDRNGVHLPRGDAQFPGALTIRHSFATGLAGLFGAACGAIALMISRARRLKAELRASQQRTEELADRVWELKESEERAKSFLAAQGDVIVRRDADGRITYVNEAFCALGARSRGELVGTTFILPVIEQGAPRIPSTVPASTTRRSTPTPAPAGSPGAR